MNTSPADARTGRTDRTFISRSPEDTMLLAGKLIGELPNRRVFALHGELGSGKTCFVRGMAAALGIRRAVTSPTFTIIREYAGPRALYHADFYRISNSIEAVDLGMEEYFRGNGTIAIEWAERAGDILPPDTVHVEFRTLSAPGERSITVRCS